MHRLHRIIVRIHSQQNGKRRRHSSDMTFNSFSFHFVLIFTFHSYCLGCTDRTFVYVEYEIERICGPKENWIDNINFCTIVVTHDPLNIRIQQEWVWILKLLISIVFISLVRYIARCIQREDFSTFKIFSNLGKGHVERFDIFGLASFCSAERCVNDPDLTSSIVLSFFLFKRKFILF